MTHYVKYVCQERHGPQRGFFQLNRGSEHVNSKR